MTNHVPMRPVWICARCGADWPCAARRAELVAEFAGAPVSLTLYLGGCLVTASRDLPLTRAGKLHYRFLGWTPKDQNDYTEVAASTRPEAATSM